eukprot:TRINITY_DN20112_c0_g1_i1.p1 TRINITY_DN20112_c0_g1~~TRINITY_DN20112_c0_g1_i1.p1  ORF type:complete len:105 (+),score=27.44 TRINITY_DN20112_c0_g1_i1:62-376(+)
MCIRDRRRVHGNTLLCILGIPPRFPMAFMGSRSYILKNSKDSLPLFSNKRENQAYRFSIGIRNMVANMLYIYECLRIRKDHRKKDFSVFLELLLRKIMNFEELL